jgi:hypothetical protein
MEIAKQHTPDKRPTPEDTKTRINLIPNDTTRAEDVIVTGFYVVVVTSTIRVTLLLERAGLLIFLNIAATYCQQYFREPVGLVPIV